MMTKTEVESGLRQFYGTEQYYKNTQLLHFQYTDGVKYMWESCDAYWLLIAISSYNRNESFQVWELKRDIQGQNAFTLTMKEDSGRPYKVEQKIEFSDFPLDEITLYLIDGVLILTTEY